jgi:hypothetical protein
MVVASLDELPVAFLGIYAGAIGGVFVLLWNVATATTPRREEVLIAATVIIGRSMAILLLAHLSMMGLEWNGVERTIALIAIAVLAVGHTWAVLQEGTASSLVVPDRFVATSEGLPSKRYAALSSRRAVR